MSDRSVLLPPYMSEVPVWQDMIKWIDQVLQGAIDDPAQWLSQLRYLYIEASTAADKISADEMLNIADFEVPEKEILIRQAKQLGFSFNNSDLITSEDYQRIVRNLGQFWYSKGKPNFVDFLGFVLNNVVTIETLWAEKGAEYGTYADFKVEGDPTMGAPVWTGGTWFPTTHVNVTLDPFQFTNPTFNKLLNLFYAIANYNLVVNVIQMDGNAPIHTVDDAQIADIVVVYPLMQIEEIGHTIGTTEDDLGVITEPLLRFTPEYFVVFSNDTYQAQAALTSTSTTLRLDYQVFEEGSQVEMGWNSQDLRDHMLVGYATNTDYTGLMWSFDLTVGANSPVFNDPVRPLLLRIVGRDSAGFPATNDVYLSNYTTTPSVRTGHFVINWNTLKAGPTNDVVFNVKDIDQISFLCNVSSYVSGSSTKLAGPVVSSAALSNITVSGSNTTITRKAMTVAAHGLALSVQYDQVWDLSPQRVVENLVDLGYSWGVTFQVGPIRAPSVRWSPLDGHYRQVLPTNTDGDLMLNPMAIIWMTQFYTLLVAANIHVTSGLGYEIDKRIARPEWCQTNWDGVAGQGNQTIPSYYLSPGNGSGMLWLQKAASQTADLMHNSGLGTYMQVYQPAWLWNPIDREPFIYDAATQAAFTAGTTLTAPDFGTVDSTATGTPYDQYKAFCQSILGQSVLNIRSAIRVTRPTAKVCACLDLYNLLDPASGIMQVINYPKTQYTFPNLDFMQTEGFDWIQLGDFVSVQQVMTEAVVHLDYPLPQMECLVGSVPDQEVDQRKQIWRRMIGNTHNNLSFGPFRQHLWDYTTIMQDSVTVIAQDDYTYFYYGETKTYSDLGT